MLFFLLQGRNPDPAGKRIIYKSGTGASLVDNTRLRSENVILDAEGDSRVREDRKEREMVCAIPLVG
jgi:hypothetical protein